MKHASLLLLLALALSAIAQQHDPALHQQHMAQASAPAVDGRELVRFPDAMKAHTLANMRDHLLALQEIQGALAASDFDRAADVAEQRLGMSSLGLHGAHDAARVMPKGMQDAGTSMHRNASKFSMSARDTAVTGDFRPALAALAAVTGACVSCHAAYRLQ